jgi:hypothetical protein
MHTGTRRVACCLKKMSRRQGESTPTHPFLKMEASTSLHRPRGRVPAWRCLRPVVADTVPLVGVRGKSMKTPHEIAIAGKGNEDLHGETPNTSTS